MNSKSLVTVLSLVLLFASTNHAFAQTCRSYKTGVKVGNIQDTQLDESSGVVASRKNPGVWWSHNDSGGKPRLYAMDETGKNLGRFDLPGAQNIDWEDMAAGPCPDGSPCLYVGDVGDNRRVRSNITIYRVPEPTVNVNAPSNGTTAKVEAFTLTYPDGPHNCETVLVHPTTRDIILVTKESNNTGIVYRLSGKTAPGTAVLEKVTTLKISGTFTGGDLSPQADQVVLRTYGSAYIYAVGEDGIPTDTNRIGRVTTPVVTQGEAIAYSLDGLHLLMTTENTPMPIYKLSCQVIPEPTPEPQSEPAPEPMPEPKPEPSSPEPTAAEPPAEPPGTNDDAGNPIEIDETGEPTTEGPSTGGCGCTHTSPAQSWGSWLVCLFVLYFFFRRLRSARNALFDGEVK